MTAKMVDRWMALPGAVRIAAYVVVGIAVGLVLR